MKQHPTPNSPLFRTSLLEDSVKRRYLLAKTEPAFADNALSSTCYKTFSDDFLAEVHIDTADLYGIAILLGITLGDALELICLHWQYGCQFQGFVREPGAYLSFTMDAVIFGREGEIRIVITVNDPMKPGLPFTAHVIYDLVSKKPAHTRSQPHPEPGIFVIHMQEDEEDRMEVSEDVSDASNS